MINIREDLELDFIRLLNDISFSLEILGQIQSCASGITMENRAAKTFELKIRLENYISQIEEYKRHETLIRPDEELPSAWYNNDD